MQARDLEKLATDVVNAAEWRHPLGGLSTEAIQSWIAGNRIDPHAMLADLVYRASDILGILLERDISPEERVALAGELRTLLVSIDAELSSTGYRG
ncbi:hypothetical protein PQJ75_07645 [Rhodoplanes sp. TEM]|uniref:Uncharacterized protein n=1 Tax=Rhodoplanes tepidamans TaxID=200616 RepID=A0ABT5JFG7_RHOTP|nr:MULTISPECIES: hypothetical protein [Rhodoplanes]MDC7788455.1 hypothetical protein [Rhodoplanes tepidamans]MDC7983600.1 hypothetical protein [Rhodoplanes sp. TEM]MDQ0354158.1 hypothetical protein [Rhodoplanes tepidamans]